MKTKIVLPGECEFSDNMTECLETYLGSCVGVAIHDPVIKTGGLLHIILPDGPDYKKEARPCYYAVTGIPHLVSGLERMGSSRKNLTASIAGGAHINTMNPSCASFNIGQRNIVMTEALLAEFGIMVAQSSLGGNWGRGMRLDVGNGRVTINSSRKEQVEPGSVDTTTCDVKQILLQKANELQPSSKVAIRALQLANSSFASFRDLTELILKDQVLAANVMKLSNSAFFGSSRTITNVSQAINLFGMDRFKKIVIQSCVMDIYPITFDRYGMEDGSFFHHSLACAKIAEAISRQIGIAEPETAYLAGLLHDLGKIVIERFAAAQFMFVLHKLSRKQMSCLQAETDSLGIDHAAIGGIISKKWQLPQELVEAIAYHHKPQNASIANELVSIVHVANHICNMLGIGLSTSTMGDELEMSAIELLKLDEKAVEGLLDIVPEILQSHDF